MENRKIKLIIGLGNPGAEYSGTYHNVGHMMVERLAGEDASWESPSNKHFEFVKGPIVLAKNTTFMNESGIAVLEAMRYFKVEPDEIMVAHDDSDMALGSYKISFAQRSAGHHGIDSAIAALGTNEFWRLKIGIRKKPGKAGEFVLKPLGKADRETIQRMAEGLTLKVIENERP